MRNARGSMLEHGDEVSVHLARADMTIRPRGGRGLEEALFDKDRVHFFTGLVHNPVSHVSILPRREQRGLGEAEKWRRQGRERWRWGKRHGLWYLGHFDEDKGWRMKDEEWMGPYQLTSFGGANALSGKVLSSSRPILPIPPPNANCEGNLVLVSMGYLHGPPFLFSLSPHPWSNKLANSPHLLHVSLLTHLTMQGESGH